MPTKPALIFAARPYELFQLVKASPSERVVSMALPCRRGQGGLTLLETSILIAAAQIVVATRVFEIGTFLGTTTLNLALNVPSDGVVFTLDLDAEDAANMHQHASDAPLTELHLHHARSLDFIGSPVENKVRTLTGDSTKFDFSPWHNSIDLVFIDGGHDYTTVKSDTENAFAMARKDAPSCVMWHDYGNSDYGELTGYLNELSQRHRIVHIQDTMLCAWFNAPAAASLGNSIQTNSSRRLA